MKRKFRRFGRLISRRKSTGYYVAIICGIALTFGFGTLAVTGEGLFEADNSLAVALHESPAVTSGEHDHTLLGDLLLGKRAEAHRYPYCGTGTIWRTIDGVLHKIVYSGTYADGDHDTRSAHYKYTGTGYTRVSDWQHYRIDC